VFVLGAFGRDIGPGPSDALSSVRIALPRDARVKNRRLLTTPA
jgi:hypothetical protein